MSVGGGEDLTVLPTGSVSVVSGSGGQTTFSLNSKSEFESQRVMKTSRLEYKSAEHRYVLKDAGRVRETVFEQPAGWRARPPGYVMNSGRNRRASAAVGDAIDSSGNVWVADWGHDRLVEFSSCWQRCLAAYGSYGSGEAADERSMGVAINYSTGNVYVTDEGNDRVEEFSLSGSFGGLLAVTARPSGSSVHRRGSRSATRVVTCGCPIQQQQDRGVQRKRVPIETFGFGVSNGEENSRLARVAVLQVSRAQVTASSTVQRAWPSPAGTCTSPNTRTIVCRSCLGLGRTSQSLVAAVQAMAS